MEDATREECPICLAPLDEAPVMTTFCCHQDMHTKCYDETVAFYETHKRDTPCPLCRATVSEYVAIEIQADTSGDPGSRDAPDARDPGARDNQRTPRESFATKRKLAYLLVLLGAHVSLVVVYKLSTRFLN